MNHDWAAATSLVAPGPGPQRAAARAILTAWWCRGPVWGYKSLQTWRAAGLPVTVRLGSGATSPSQALASCMLRNWGRCLNNIRIRKPFRALAGEPESGQDRAAEAPSQGPGASAAAPAGGLRDSPVGPASRAAGGKPRLNRYCHWLNCSGSGPQWIASLSHSHCHQARARVTSANTLLIIPNYS